RTRSQHAVLNQGQGHVVAVRAQAHGAGVELRHVAGIERIARFNNQVLHSSPPFDLARDLIMRRTNPPGQTTIPTASSSSGFTMLRRERLLLSGVPLHVIQGETTGRFVVRRGRLPARSPMAGAVRRQGRLPRTRLCAHEVAAALAQPVTRDGPVCTRLAAPRAGATFAPRRAGALRKEERRMLFEPIVTGGCRSYLIGCPDSCAAAVIDPEISQTDRYLGLAAREGLRIHYLIDTHTHADHFSATHELARRLQVPVVMHRASPAPFVDMRLNDGDMLVVGKLRLQAMHTPGHTRDSMCLRLEDRLLTGDTLLIGATGRTDLPTGDPEALYDSLFHCILKLDPTLKVFPAHDYGGRGESTLARELAENPRLRQRERAMFVETMLS